MTTSEHDPVSVLSRALEQTADLLGQVRAEHLGQPTPCTEWTVRQLVDHLVTDPVRFAQMLRGEAPDWSAPSGDVEEDWTGAFRRGAADLLALWHQQDQSTTGQADWQSAEMAVHCWDLARAIEATTDGLDPVVAERGLAFMRQHLTEQNRGGAFGPEQPAPDGASPYDRIAALAGRRV